MNVFPQTSVSGDDAGRSGGMPDTSILSAGPAGTSPEDNAFAQAIDLDARIARFNAGSGGAYGKILGEDLRLARGIIVDSNALYCEVSQGSGSSDGYTPTMAWFHYFLVAFTDVHGRQVRVWSGDVPYSARDLELGSAVVVQYANRESADDIRIRRIFTYPDFNVSMPGTVRDVQGGAGIAPAGRRAHHVSGEDDYQDPRSFGAKWRQAPWGTRYGTSGMDGYRLFGRSARPENAGEGETARASVRAARALQAVMEIAGFGFCLSLAVSPLLSMFGVDASLPYRWVATIVFLLVFLICAVTYYLRYGAAKRAAGSAGRPRWHIDERAKVLDAVTVPLFNADAFCGYGYVARLERQTGETVWAMGDPEAGESYLAHDGRPPVAAGDEVTLMRSGKRMYVRRVQE